MSPGARGADALAAHAADAVDDQGERRAVEGHLARCPACWATAPGIVRIAVSDEPADGSSRPTTMVASSGPLS